MECAAYIETVTGYRVPQPESRKLAYLRESGLRCVLVHMSRPLTAKRAQRDCEADGVPGNRLRTVNADDNSHQ